MRNKILFALVVLGIIAGLISAFVYAQRPASEPPVFNPAPNPFANGIYANGIVESYQEHGHNTNMYPEVAGTVLRILVSDGQAVTKGQPLLESDSSVQLATTEQLEAQAEAARAVLEELRAQPRPETLAVARAQVKAAEANVATAVATRNKQQRAFAMDPRAVTKETLDTGINAAKAAGANLEVAKRQYELTKVGAWVYDIQNQEHQAEALAKQAASARALLAKYTVRAPRDGVVLSVEAAVGSYVSPQGVYDPYTQLYMPIITVGDAGTLAVRAYVDEVLIPRLPDPAHLVARMFIRGTNVSVPLQLARVQPYVTPKIQLSNQRTEKVDLRVLPIVFKFTPPADMNVYPGQLVDVYLAARAPAARAVQGAPP
jgi:HlyD family secretion protein